MYQRSARFYDSLFIRDYAGATAKLCAQVEALTPTARTWLDVACGTGGHLEHLRSRFQVEGLDLSSEMLGIARDRFPELSFHQGDFTGFRLGKSFDVVTCLFASLGYATTLAGLNQAVASMAEHVKPGGVLAVEPWVTPDRFIENKLVMDRVDQPDLKVARTYVSTRKGRLSVYDIHYLVGTPEGVSYFVEHEELGLFTGEEYRDAFSKAGLEVVIDDPIGLFGYGLLVGVRRT